MSQKKPAAAPETRSKRKRGGATPPTTEDSVRRTRTTKGQAVGIRKLIAQETAFLGIESAIEVGHNTPEQVDEIVTHMIETIGRRALSTLIATGRSTLTRETVYDAVKTLTTDDALIKTMQDKASAASTRREQSMSEDKTAKLQGNTGVKKQSQQSRAGLTLHVTRATKTLREALGKNARIKDETGVLIVGAVECILRLILDEAIRRVHVEGRVRVMPLDVIAAVQSLKALDVLFDGVYWASASPGFMPGPPEPKKAKKAAAPGEPDDAMDVDEGSAEEPAGSQEEAEVEPDVPEEEEEAPKRKKSRKGAK